ncbi:MAG: VCBS repeat-containing protein [Deltaproteobacteria bacterium]|nr:VCBS repeat-containing protein [Deltaproteobacteria bacterium]
MRNINGYFSLWHSLLAISLIIMVYLITLHINEALSYSSIAKYFNQANAHISWAPSNGEVDHYLLEITDTRFLSDSSNKNSMTSVKHIGSKITAYQLKCEHNHSYKIRVKAVSPSGISSPYSQESVLFICDREKPEISPTTLPSLKKVRLNTCSITGSFYEPHLLSIRINGEIAAINPVDMSFEAGIVLKPGENQIDILANDLAGNTTRRTLSLNYAPLTILSLPLDARIYWNGNYAYLGIYSGNTPKSYNQAVNGKQVLRITYPGFNDYYGMIDFSDLSKDIYTISLTPSSKLEFNNIIPIKSEGKEIDLGEYSHPFVVDYNLDGEKDLLIGTYEGKIAIFTNKGTDKTPQFSGYSFLKEKGKDIDVGSHAAPFMVDYNNDGVSDLLVGNREGYLIYYENKGDNHNPLFTSPIVLKDANGSDISVESYSTPLVLDWNHDNKKDIVLGSGSGTLSLYLNKGSDSDPSFSPPLPIEADGIEVNVGSFASPLAADINRDGVRDLLIGDGKGDIHVYLGSDRDRGIHLTRADKLQLNGQELMVEGSSVPFPMDWNNDGNLDLLTGSSDGKIYVLTL